MRGQFLHNKVTAAIASGASISTYVDIMGANRVAIELPAYGTLLGATNANAYVQVAHSTGDTFRRLQDMGAYSSNSGIQDWESPFGTGDKMVLCRPVVGFNYMKIHMGTAATDGYDPIVHILY